jgi:hypothetical protein
MAGPSGMSGPTICLFGNGFDGNVTEADFISGAIPNPLNRDYYFENLSLMNFTLATGGYRIFVKNELHLQDACIINNGCDGGPTPPAGANLCSGGAGAANGTMGGGTNGGSSFVTNHGNVVAAPGANTNADQVNAGGRGGDAGTSAGNLIDLATLHQWGGLELLNMYPQNATGRTLNDIQIWGGTGGGGSLAGPGGGGGGGIVGIFACRISGTGCVQARGGDGYPNGPGPTGGGGGGVVILSFLFGQCAQYTIDVSGGLGFNGGHNGQDGNVFCVQIKAT